MGGQSAVKTAAAVTMVLGLYAAPARADVYTNAATFLSSVNSTITVQPLPAYVATYADAFGTYSSPTMRGPLTVLAGPRPGGSIDATFGCFGNTSSCTGAYSETITLPFAITGIAGQLDYSDPVMASGPLSLLGLPGSAFSPPFIDNSAQSFGRYTGFYAQTFAPTTTLTFTWQPGLQSYDGSASFDLSSATVLVATPEPSTAVVLATALVVLLVGGAWNGAGFGRPRGT